ncbi:MAG: YerC/YecD family TrpR-related protein [Patescibacteria group bacterium]
MEKWDNRKTKDLIEIVLALKSEKEAKMFLRDLMTEKELLELGNRWKAARMLSEKISYPEIQKETGLSSRTIARISKWLKNGKGGYRLALNKIKHHNYLKQRKLPRMVSF